MRGAALVLFLTLATAATAAPELDPVIGARIDPETRLTDASGIEASFRELHDQDGTLLLLGYHRCTNICGVLQRALAETLIDVRDPPRVLFVSLDPGERPEDARAMRAELAAAAPAANLAEWRFLTGAAPALASLSEPLGLEAYVRPGGEVLVHPVAVGVLTPDGALSEVFYGLDFTAPELERALARAADGYVGGLRERVILLCSGIDEAVGQVARTAWTGIRLAAVATLALMAVGLLRLWREGRR